MKIKNDGGPAYPGPADYRMDGTPIWNGDRGMSLRDHFAGLAMQALVAKDTMITTNVLCAEAYIWADAMLEARGAN